MLSKQSALGTGTGTGHHRPPVDKELDQPRKRAKSTPLGQGKG